jgi:hypothetical protein
MQRGKETLVSNSLPCMLKRIGGSVEATERGFQRLIGTIGLGIDEYTREIPTSAGIIRLAYYHNLVWDGSGLREIEKPDTVPVLKSFEDYHTFIQSSVKELATNLADARRKFPFTMLGTMSSGYDSACVSALGREAGLKRVISFATAKTGKADSGEAVAKALGLELVLVDRNAWRETNLPEVAFVSSDAKGEDVYFKSAEHELTGKVLLTGFSGDLQWETHYHHRGPRFVRGDRAGLSLSEYRLRVGFINWPVPFMGAMHQDQIVAISNSEQMKPWDVGGDYSRPIARRILEMAGVPNGSYAKRKQAASVLLAEHRNMLSASTAEDFGKWLEEHAAEFWAKGMMPPQMKERLLRPVQWVARKGWVVYARSKSMPAVRRWSRSAAEWGEKEWVTWFLFPWAVERAKEAYQ